jgi:sugar lactone lactonase YvrE
MLDRGFTISSEDANSEDANSEDANSEDANTVEPFRFPSGASKLREVIYFEDFARTILCFQYFAARHFNKYGLKSHESKTLRKNRGGEGYHKQSRFALAVALLVAVSVSLHAQGILTVTPTRSVATGAGTGAVGYTGDNGAAASATLANPSAVAYDASGNLYVADTQNNVVREISKGGQISTIAGTGIEGYGGDNAAAISAFLDKPTGVAVDTSGNVYIADSHNHRIRKVGGGTITTIAGTGIPGFSGDNAAASAAQLDLPTAVAVDSSGNIYIADTNNQRIRKITGTTISTIAGDGEELFGGDGGAATAAVLDSPTGIAIDASGNIYIADRHNQRIRRIAGTTISTIAGSGAASFSGSFSGDGASATAATLARPSAVSVDAAGDIYIADTGNQRIRELGGGAIATIVGSGQQGYGGDGATPASVNLDMPRAIATDASGNLTIADTLNQRLRSGILPTLTFVSQMVGIVSAPQSITLTNSGTASLTVSNLAFSGAFTTAVGGSCSVASITLAPGANCTENIAFLPTSAGATSGSVTVTGSGIIPQTVLLAGIGAESTTTIALTSNSTSAFIGQPVTFTATVKPAGLGMASGKVSFYDGTTLLGTAQPLSNNAASLAVTTLAVGTHSIQASYSGDANFTGGTSTSVAEMIGDFNFTIIPNPSNPAGSVNQTVTPGQSAVFSLTIQPISGPFNFPVTLSATGLPPGATVVFNPQIVTVGAAAANFSMTIQTAATTATLHRTELFGGGTLTFALLLLPFSGTLRRRKRYLRQLTMAALLLASGAMLTTLTGCGTNSGFFGQPQKTYNIQVTGTASGATGATLQHVTTVQLTLQ